MKTTMLIAASLSIVLLAAGCSDNRVGIRKWKENKDGVLYNKTCIEGDIYIATPGSHSEISVAGPVGKCS